jgi:hypothetical protein
MMHALTGVNALLKMFYTTKEIIGNCPKMNRLEDFNNTIDRIVRKTYGYRDLEYLFLKIRQEATG